MAMYSETSDLTGVLENDEELWLQDVAVQIAESGPSGVRFLISSISKATEWRLRAILLGLSAVKKPSTRLRTEICDIAKQFLHDDRPTIVAEAVDLLSHLDCTDACEVILELRRHASPYVVGSVLRYLARHFSRDRDSIAGKGTRVQAVHCPAECDRRTRRTQLRPSLAGDQASAA